jgi:hypothetical protein
VKHPKLSARAAAKTLGITHPALIKAARTGRVTPEADGSYDVDKVRRELAQNSNALKRRHTKAPVREHNQGVRTLAEAERQRAWLRVQKDELELARKRGELIEVYEVKKAAFAKARLVRDRLMTLPSRVSTLFAAETDPQKIHQALEDEIRKALVELAGAEDAVGDLRDEP